MTRLIEQQRKALNVTQSSKWRHPQTCAMQETKKSRLDQSKPKRKWRKTIGIPVRNRFD
jgi:hypothetical protein